MDENKLIEQCRGELAEGRLLTSIMVLNGNIEADDWVKDYLREHVLGHVNSGDIRARCGYVDMAKEILATGKFNIQRPSKRLLALLGLPVIRAKPCPHTCSLLCDPAAKGLTHIAGADGLIDLREIGVFLDWHVFLGDGVLANKDRELVAGSLLRYIDTGEESFTVSRLSQSPSRLSTSMRFLRRSRSQGHS